MNMQSLSDDHEFKRTKPFKLCFVSRREPGRSYVSIGKPSALAGVIAPKFYVENNFGRNENDIANKINRLIVTGPKDDYSYHRTENQRYGWYECHELNDCMLNFRRSASQLVKEHLMVYEKIRE